MGGFFSSPEQNSSLGIGNNMGASGSKINAAATAPRMNGTNGMNKNVELGVNARVNARVNTNASDPGTPGANNTRRNNKSRNNKSRNNVALNVNRLQEVVVEEPSQPNAGQGLVGNSQAGGSKYRKGSRKYHRRNHKSRRR